MFGSNMFVFYRSYRQRSILIYQTSLCCLANSYGFRPTSQTDLIHCSPPLLPCSALNPTCYILIPQLFAPGVFRDAPTISLHLLDVGAIEEDLQGVRMETEDLALPQLHKVTVYTELDQAFQQAHFIILLDDSWPECGGEDEEESKVCSSNGSVG